MVRDVKPRQGPRLGIVEVRPSPSVFVRGNVGCERREYLFLDRVENLLRPARLESDVDSQPARIKIELALFDWKYEFRSPTTEFFCFALYDSGPLRALVVWYCGHRSSLPPVSPSKKDVHSPNSHVCRCSTDLAHLFERCPHALLLAGVCGFQNLFYLFCGCMKPRNFFLVKIVDTLAEIFEGASVQITDRGHFGHLS